MMVNGGGNGESHRTQGYRHFSFGAARFFRQQSVIHVRDRSTSISRTSSSRNGSQESDVISKQDKGGRARADLRDLNAVRGPMERVQSQLGQEKKVMHIEEPKVSSRNGSFGNAIKRGSSFANARDEDELVDGWPKWLTDNIPRDALDGLTPRSAETYEKIDKVGQGTYSNVYKARDKYTGKVVAMKKVRFDTSEPESVKFMSREIRILRKLDHPNIMKLEGLATSRMHYSIYLVFEYMESDLTSIITRPDERLTEPQVKCYMQQLLSGLQHCHERGILHRDIKGSNLLIDRKGMLKIADFGLANYYNPEKRRPLTTRVVTLWYRAPELLLGATEYGPGIDLWSAGCLMAEMFIGKPIMAGRTEVEQIHKIFKLCGSPSEDVLKRMKLPSIIKPPKAHKSKVKEVLKNFPASSYGLLCNLLAVDPTKRGSAASSLQDQFFYTRPLACDLAGLPAINHMEDSPIQPFDLTKQSGSKLKQNSQSMAYRQKESMEIKPEETIEVFSGQEKSAETIILSQGPESSRTSSSSSAKHTTSGSSTEREKEEKAKTWPVTSQNYSRTREFVQLASSSSTKKYNRPENNNSKGNYNYKVHQMYRSVSTVELWNQDQNNMLELSVVD